MEKTTGMVCINGMNVPADKVEGRMNALRLARERKEMYVAAEMSRKAKERKELRDKNYTEAEINTMFSAENIARMEGMGLGVSRRVRRVHVPA